MIQVPKEESQNQVYTPEQSDVEGQKNDLNRPLLLLEHVTKTYASVGGGVQALKDTHLSIMRGEFVAIVGTSGSGKSTLMNILGCLDRPTSGKYKLDGFDVGLRTADGRAILRNRLIGFIFQGFNLLSRTSALENVELPLAYRGIPRKERRLKAEKVLKQVGLENRMDHTPNQLSGGQQQRVAIARALVSDPALLLADEPTGNLDTRTSLEVLSLLQELNQKQNITIVLVTHEPDIAACASRVITMRDGSVISDHEVTQPTLASRELLKLGLSVESHRDDEEDIPAKSESSEKLDERKLEREQTSLHVPHTLPFGVYVRLFLGSLLGMSLGLAYNKWLIGTPSASLALFVVLAFTLLFEAIWAVHFVAASPLKIMTVNEMVVLAWRYTLFTLVLPAVWITARLPLPFMSYKMPDGPLVWVIHLSVWALAMSFIFIAARVFFLWLFSLNRKREAKLKWMSASSRKRASF